MEPDFLDEMLDEGEAVRPGFKVKVDEAVQRRVLGRVLIERRKAAGLTQAEIARRMHTSQPAVSRLERGLDDVRISTLIRYLAEIGESEDWPERIFRQS